MVKVATGWLRLEQALLTWDGGKQVRYDGKSVAAERFTRCPMTSGAVVVTVCVLVTKVVLVRLSV